MSTIDTNDSIPIQTSGITAFIATDYVGTGGITGHYQLIKLAYGVDGSATVVDSSSPLPVSVSGGLTATISGFTGTFSVQGIGGSPVVVSGTVVATGVTYSPVYVRTPSGFQVEVTGGIPLSKTTSSVSVWGPSGNTWVYSNMVDSSGNQIGVSANPMYTIISGATISVTIDPTVGVTNESGTGLRIQGFSGGLPVTVGVTGEVNVNDADIIAGITALGATMDAVYNALSVFGLVRPTSVASGLLTVTTGATMIGSSFACKAGVNVKALGSNTDLIYLGNTFVGTSYGYQLEPGESVFFDVGNLSHIYAAAKSGSQILSYFAS